MLRVREGGERIPVTIADYAVPRARSRSSSRGKTLTLDELFDKLGYAVVFVGTGAGLPQFLGIAGEDLNGVMSANEFLTRVNLMRGYDFPETDTPVNVGKRVAVIGAGNTAIDAARTALRMGAEEAMIVYRRGEKEMSARVEEYSHAIEEGVRFHWLTSPLEVTGSADGWVTGLRCQKMRLGEPDRSGRARPVPIPGEDVTIPVDSVVLAIGTTPNPLLTRTTSGLITTKDGCLVADERTGRTSKPLVGARRPRVRRSADGSATVMQPFLIGQATRTGATLRPRDPLAGTVTTRILGNARRVPVELDEM